MDAVTNLILDMEKAKMPQKLVTEVSQDRCKSSFTSLGAVIGAIKQLMEHEKGSETAEITHDFDSTAAARRLNDAKSR